MDRGEGREVKERKKDCSGFFFWTFGEERVALLRKLM